MPTTAALAVRHSPSGCPLPADVAAGPAAWPAARSAGACDALSEFELRRHAIAQAGRRKPLERVAALLVAISNNNRYEGCDPCAIPDFLTCGFVADLLGLSITSLGGILVEMQERRLVEAAPSSGLRLKDLAGLERLAEAH
jgi:hypothetical protein